MLPFILLILSFFIVLEGQYLWQVLLTWLSLVGSLYCIPGGERALACWRQWRVRGGTRLRLSLRPKVPGRVWLFNRTFVELITFGHVVVTPPWFFWMFGDFFFPGLCLIGVSAGAMRLVNDRLGRQL